MHAIRMLDSQSFRNRIDSIANDHIETEFLDLHERSVQDHASRPKRIDDLFLRERRFDSIGIEYRQPFLAFTELSWNAG